MKVRVCMLIPILWGLVSITVFSLTGIAQQEDAVIQLSLEEVVERALTTGLGAPVRGAAFPISIPETNSFGQVGLWQSSGETELNLGLMVELGDLFLGFDGRLGIGEPSGAQPPEFQTTLGYRLLSQRTEPSYEDRLRHWRSRTTFFVKRNYLGLITLTGRIEQVKQRIERAELTGDAITQLRVELQDLEAKRIFKDQRLRTLIGLSPGTEFELITLPEIPELDLDPQEALDRALANNPKTRPVQRSPVDLSFQLSWDGSEWRVGLGVSGELTGPRREAEQTEIEMERQAIAERLITLLRLYILRLEERLELQVREERLLNRYIDDPADRVRYLEWRMATIDRQLNNGQLNLIKAGLDFIIEGGDPRLIDEEGL
ncbi:MAG: hypothetical protein ACE5JP_05070 [Candidatus Bipolaricaulia bacterium]